MKLIELSWIVNWIVTKLTPAHPLIICWPTFLFLAGLLSFFLLYASLSASFFLLDALLSAFPLSFSAFIQSLVSLHCWTPTMTVQPQPRHEPTPELY